MDILTIANYKVWCKNVKSQLFSCGYHIWRLVCEGCGKDPIVDKFLQQDVQARCIIYKNIHDYDLNRLVGLKYAKDMWDKLESIFGDGTNNNMKNEKRRRKNKKKNKKGLQ